VEIKVFLQALLGKRRLVMGAKRIINTMGKRRITNGNCSPPCSGGSGSAKRQSGYALCGILLHHILPALVLLRKPLFGLAKRQLPVTLGAISTDKQLKLI